MGFGIWYENCHARCNEVYFCHILPSKPPFLLSILGEIVLGRQDGHSSVANKKTDTSVELKKLRQKLDGTSRCRHGVIDTIIYTSYNEYVLGKFIAR